jgi:pyruvate dehydrogenase E2 component (dihydrolipoamide acetyltransferase)
MDVLMPQLGETVSEGKITKWFKTAGDQIKPGDNLFEIETDKVSMEVPSTTAGVLAEIRVAAGEVAPVGAVVAVIGDAGEVHKKSIGGNEKQSQAHGGLPLPAGERVGVRGFGPIDPSVTPSPPPSPQVGRGSPAVPSAAVSAVIKLDPFFEVRTPERNYGPARLAGGAVVTPLARRLASEAGIDLARLTGSGPHGRIVARDIESARSHGAARAGAPAALVAGPTADQVKAIYRDTPFEEVPLDGMRATIAARLVQAKQTIPHFYLSADVEIGRLLALREEANAAAPKDRDGKPAFRLSLNDLVIKAWAAALQRVPAANAVWAVDRILRFRHSDIGIAVAIAGGLITPVIRQAETKTLSAISAEMRELAERARARRLKPGEYQGGTSAISNLGMYGIREFAAIINPPQATILAVGVSRRQAFEKPDGGVAFASVMTVTLSCDHRVVDGVLGAELLAAFRGFIEQPVTALV